MTVNGENGKKHPLVLSLVGVEAKLLNEKLFKKQDSEEKSAKEQTMRLEVAMTTLAQVYLHLAYILLKYVKLLLLHYKYQIQWHFCYRIFCRYLL